jgi:hypothetical protein
MYHRKQRDKVEKRVNCGICLYPSTVQALEKYRGEYSRSGLIESILIEYLDANEIQNKSTTNGLVKELIKEEP